MPRLVLKSRHRERLQVRAAQLQFKAIPEPRQLTLDFLGTPYVVSVLKRDEFRSGQADASVAGRGNARVILWHVSDAVAVGRDNAVGAVGRAIVNDDRFKER